MYITSIAVAIDPAVNVEAITVKTNSPSPHFKKGDKNYEHMRTWMYFSAPVDGGIDFVKENFPGVPMEIYDIFHYGDSHEGVLRK